MSTLALYTYKFADGTSIQSSAYFNDLNITTTTTYTFSLIEDLQSFLQTLFDDDKWFMQLGYYYPGQIQNSPPTYANIYTLFPRFKEGPDKGMNVYNILYDERKVVALSTYRMWRSTTGSYVGQIFWQGSTSTSPALQGHGSPFGCYVVLGPLSDSTTAFSIQLKVFPTKYIKGGKLDFSTLEYNAQQKYYRLPYYSVDIEKQPRQDYKVTVRPLDTNGFAIYEDAYNYWNGLGVPSYNEEDPYGPGGTSQGGGGGGSFTGGGTSIGHPGLPTIQASDTGFMTLYSPSVSQVKNMASYMWSDSFSLDDFKKIFADPMQSILSLHAVPVPVSKGQIRTVKIGNIDTGVFMPPVTNQWVTVDCGSLTLPAYWGSYLDFDPYTKLQLFLPYIGTFTVSADDVISTSSVPKSLSLSYNFDVLSGVCVATLTSAGTTLYNFQGTASMQIPFTSLTYGNLLSSLAQASIGIAGAALSGAATGGISLAAGAGALAASTSAAVSAQKTSVAHGGSIGGSGGFMGVQVPYFILTRPSLCLPKNQNEFIGYPSFTTVTLSSLSGFTRVEEIHLEGMSATKDELNELDRMLKEGVIF